MPMSSLLLNTLYIADKPTDLYKYVRLRYIPVYRYTYNYHRC